MSLLQPNDFRSALHAKRLMMKYPVHPLLQCEKSLRRRDFHLERHQLRQALIGGAQGV